jgi:ssDNA-binding Zn-finger/Zn-ribbon topoisomerase 1
VGTIGLTMTNEETKQFDKINAKLDRLLNNTYEVQLETVCPSCGKATLEMDMSRVSNTKPPKRLYTCGVCNYLTYKPVTYSKNNT